MIECIAFTINAFDTHAAYNKSQMAYTIVADGDYAVRDSDGWRKITLKQGDTLMDIKEVVAESCGVFYSRALNQIRQCRE